MRGRIDRRQLLFLAGAAAIGAPARSAGSLAVPPFSGAPLGIGVASGWEHQTLPKVPQANSFAIVDDGGLRVLRVHSEAAASNWLAKLSGETPRRPVLQWRWKVSRALAGSDLRSKQGDDYAARVYVLFDFPDDRLNLADRLRLRAARVLAGTDVPGAAICYVWGQAQPPGTSAWNPYTDRVRMVVIDSGDTYAQRWRNVRRDVHADWDEAFGGAMPRIAAVAVGADTDNTRDTVDAWFTDLAFSELP